MPIRKTCLFFISGITIVRLSKTSILISALIFGGIGFACLFFPFETASGVDFELKSVTATVDFRATYGGLLIGIGIFFVISLFRQNFIRPALYLQALSLGGFAFGRLTGIILDGMPKPVIIYFTVAEIGGAILAIYCLRRDSQT